MIARNEAIPEEEGVTVMRGLINATIISAVFYGLAATALITISNVLF